MSYIAQTYDFPTAIRMAIFARDPANAQSIVDTLDILKMEPISDDVSIVSTTWDGLPASFWCEAVEINDIIYMKVTEFFGEDK